MRIWQMKSKLLFGWLRLRGNGESYGKMENRNLHCTVASIGYGLLFQRFGYLWGTLIERTKEFSMVYIGAPICIETPIIGGTLNPKLHKP